MKKTFSDFFDDYLTDALTVEEEEIFLAMLDYPENRIQLDSLLGKKMDDGEFTVVKDEARKAANLVRLQNRIHNLNIGRHLHVHRIHFLKTAWFRYAAVVLVVFGIGAYLYFTQTNHASTKTDIGQQDVSAPESNRATLTLANGQKIFLDNAQNGPLARQINADIEKSKSGDIVYHANRISEEMQYNTLSVPKGSQIASIILSDGSKVYLNAASSVRYPVVFDRKERKIEISGEAYLEIAKNKNKKFIVESKGVITEVLGTNFNVNSFSDEEVGFITLLEGSIKVTKDSESVVIMPGEQVLANANKRTLIVNHKANMGQVMAWQKGLFIFTDMSLPSILRQVERWYNINLKYEGILPLVSYTGGLSRNLPLSEVIKLLQSEKITLDIKGNILTIKPKI